VLVGVALCPDHGHDNDNHGTNIEERNGHQEPNLLRDSRPTNYFVANSPINGAIAKVRPILDSRPYHPKISGLQKHCKKIEYITK